LALRYANSLQCIILQVAETRGASLRRPLTCCAVRVTVKTLKEF
jgi:hypothetical protein